MFPYRDENQTQRTAIVTIAIIGLNIVVWLFVQGAGADFPLAKSVCELGLIPAEITASVPPGTSFSMAPVPAWLVDASPWQHVVSVALRQQCRGLHGQTALRPLLSSVWFGCCFRPSRDESRCRNSHGRRLGRDHRGHGRLFGSF